MQLGMTMSAEDASPAVISDSSGEQHHPQEQHTGGVAAADATGVGGDVKGSGGAATVVPSTNIMATAEGAATPPLPEEPLQGKELLEAIKKQVGVLRRFCAECFAMRTSLGLRV